MIKSNEDPKIVQFENGMYAIRKISRGNTWFRDISSGSHWWQKGDTWFKDCITKDIKVIEEKLKDLNISIHKDTIRRREQADMGYPVKYDTVDTTIPESIEEPAITKPQFKLPKLNLGNWFKD